MSSKYQAEAELQRRWGASFAANLDKAVDGFDLLPAHAQNQIDQNNPDQIAALAAMASPAYTDPKNPDHARVAAQVQAHFNNTHNDPDLIY